MGEYRKDGVTNIDFSCTMADFLSNHSAWLLEKHGLSLPPGKKSSELAKFFSSTDLSTMTGVLDYSSYVFFQSGEQATTGLVGFRGPHSHLSDNGSRQKGPLDRGCFDRILWSHG
jgi:hypothetical protein